MNAQVPQPQRAVKQVALPLLAIIVFGVLTTIVLVIGFHAGPVAFLWALLPVAVMIVGAAMTYLWLDRWEPEPRGLLLGAFLWGGGVAAGLSLVLNTVTNRYLWPNEVWAAAVGAPLFEETTKGMFLVLMLTGTRRRELNSLTDVLVYAGMVGLGFAFVEDMLYFAQAGDADTGIALFIFRMVMGVFAHPLFTSMTALGVWFAVKTPRRGVRGVWVGCGFLLAMTCHGIWNGSTEVLNGFGFFLAYGLILVPVFAAVVVTAILARRNEGLHLLNQLPSLVHEGIIDHHEAIWLASLPKRGERRRLAAKVGGRAARWRLQRFTDSVTEFALLRTRMANSPPDQKLWNDYHYLWMAVHQNRAAAIDVLVAVHRSISPRYPQPMPPMPQQWPGTPPHHPGVSSRW